MKIYIRAVTIEELEQKYGKEPGMTKQTFKTIYNLDPTGDYDTKKRGKYAPWLFKQYKAGNLDIERDRQNIHDTLSDLADRVRSRAYQQKDINQYKTVEELVDAHRAAMNTDVALTRRQQTRNAHREAKEIARKRLAGENTGDITELATDGTWTLYTPNTHAGDIALAMVGVDTTRPYTNAYTDADNLKAQWCTAAEGSYGKGYYDGYTAKGPLYVFIDSTDPIHKYQTNIAATDYDTSWFFDFKDHDQGERAFFAFLDKHPNFKEFFRVRDEGGVQFMGDTIRGYSETAEEIQIPEGVITLPNCKFPAACKTVILPDSLTTISERAFKGSNVEIVIANNITNIGAFAFESSAIREIDLSKVKTIGPSAFGNCQYLAQVNFRRGVQLAANAFSGCESLTGPITQYPETVIASGTYNNCSNLTLIWLDEDAAYYIDGIRLLKVDMATHPELVAANRDYIDIEDL